MSLSERSLPGHAEATRPMTNTASNSRPLAWCTVITCTPEGAAGTPASPRKPSSPSPDSSAARPRASRSGRRSATPRASPSRAFRPASRAAPSAPPAARAAARSPHPSSTAPSTSAAGSSTAARPAAVMRRSSSPAPASRPTASRSASTGRPAAAASATACAAAPQGSPSAGSAAIRRCACASKGSVEAPQPGHRRAHLAPLEQAHAAAHLVRHAGALQLAHQRPRLQAHRAHEHRLLLVGDALGGQPDDLGDHRAGLAVGVRRGPDLGRRPLGAVAGDQALGRPVRDPRDHRAGGVEHGLRRAVVALEPDLGGVREAPAEVGQVLRRRAAEAVDALVVVAHHDQARRAAAQQVEQLGLGVVGVLELVDQDVASLGPRGLEPVRVGPQQRQRAHDRLAEVLEPVLGQPAVVGLVDPRELGVAPAQQRLRRRAGAGDRRLGPAAEVGRGHQLVLAAVDAPQEAVDQVDPVAAQVVQLEIELAEPLEQQHHARLAVGRLGRRQQPALDPVHPREPLREGVEGGDAERLVRAAQQVLGAAAQLVRRLAGEGEREHLVRRRAAVDEPGQAVAEHPRLARAGAGEHGQRAARVGHGGALLGGQVGKHRTSDARPGPGRRRTPVAGPPPLLASRAVADVRPFRALAYDEAQAGPLAALVAPPYDVISPEQRAGYLAASPHNAVHLILPELPYDEVAGLLAGLAGRGRGAPGRRAAAHRLDPDLHARRRRRARAAHAARRGGPGALRAARGAPPRADPRRARRRTACA